MEHILDEKPTSKIVWTCLQHLLHTKLFICLNNKSLNMYGNAKWFKC